MERRSALGRIHALQGPPRGGALLAFEVFRLTSKSKPKSFLNSELGDNLTPNTDPRAQDQSSAEIAVPADWEGGCACV